MLLRHARSSCSLIPPNEVDHRSARRGSVNVEQLPRLTSIAGVARALLATVGVDEGVGILVGQFGWDVTFAALAQLPGEDAAKALWRAVERLVHDDLPT